MTMPIKCLVQCLAHGSYSINGRNGIKRVGLHADFSVAVNNTNSFISAFLSSSCDVPDDVLGIGVTATGKTDQNPSSHSAFLLMEREKH